MDPLSLLALVPPAISAGQGLYNLFGGGSKSNQKTNPMGTHEQISRFTPSQSQALNDLLMQGVGGLKGLQAPSFDPIEQHARSQFQQKTIPSIAERFAGLNAQSSSAFPQALGEAGADLESMLASQKAQFGQQQYGQQLNHLMSLLNLGLTPQYDTLYRPEQPSLWQSTLPGLAAGVGQSLPSLFKLLSQFGNQTPNIQKPNEQPKPQGVS